jgi:two-component system chemotaxis response regulator CheB
MDKRNIIVIGASAGGFDALKQFVEHLPGDFNASIFIVWHMSPDVRGILPHVLNKSGKLTAAHAVDGEPVMMKRIYIAPPDHHLLLENGRVRVTRGPKENGFRPSVDPLFRSAALAYGTRVIGIVLSGALDDGAAGLWAIKQQGGVAIVQDPSDAEVPSMPINAIKAVNADYIVPVDSMGALLAKLTEENIASGQETGGMADEKRTRLEVSIAMEGKNSKANVFEYGQLTEFTCPECHGVLAALYEGNRIRFRCHTGHAFSADSLLAGITENIEETLWTAIRSIQESVFLLNHLGDHFSETNQPRIAAAYFKKAKKAAKRADLIRQAVFDHEQLNTDSIEKHLENR